MESVIILALELIGTLAFAVSGAMTGLKKNMDIFGVCILGLTTAVGGGVVRDLILGITPPNTFQDPFSAMVALFVSAVFFLRRFRHFLMHRPEVYELMMLWLDSIGLGAFTVIEKGSVIGDGAVIEAQVFIGEGCNVGAKTHNMRRLT